MIKTIEWRGNNVGAIKDFVGDKASGIEVNIYQQLSMITTLGLATYEVGDSVAIDPSGKVGKLVKDNE